MKKTLHNLGKALALILTFVMVISLVDLTPVQAASDDIKVVYTIKQLKKALKSKKNTTIALRTETYDKLTIPSVKNSKNKELYICAPYAKITNKSKFKTITVYKCTSFTEAVSGNTIIWKDSAFRGLTVAKGKTLNKLVFSEWAPTETSYTLRKGAKLKELAFEGDGISSKMKNRTVTLIFSEPVMSRREDRNMSFKLDKSGRIIQETCEFLSSENFYSDSYKYDKNGNVIDYTSSRTGDLVSSQIYEYDANNNCIKEEVLNNAEVFQIELFEYDEKGNELSRCVKNPYGTKEYYTYYKYDNKGRCLEELIKDASSTVHYNYSYDSAGRLNELSFTSDDENVKYTYRYDKNGLCKQVQIYFYDGTSQVIDYPMDYLGNTVYMVSKILDTEGECVNLYRYQYYLGQYIGDTPRYEDGFVSPVGKKPFDGKEHEAQGYIVVSTPEELIESIAPDTKIIIAPGKYNLSDYIEKQDMDKFNESHKYVKLLDEFDGYELIIQDVDNLLISGGSAYQGQTEIVIEPRYANVFSLHNCNNIKLNQLTVGHTETGGCTGDVLCFEDCHDIGIYGMDIYGCGVYGISVYNFGTSYPDAASGNIRVYNSIIRDCSQGAFAIHDLDDSLTFTNCMFYGSNGGGYINNTKDGKIIFKKCTFGREETNRMFFEENAEFEDCLFGKVTQYPEY